MIILRDINGDCLRKHIVFIAITFSISRAEGIYLMILKTHNSVLF